MTDANRTTETKLSPCPFCGSTDIAVRGTAHARSGGMRWWAECDDCDVTTGTDSTTEAEAVAQWNRRASPEPRDESSRLAFIRGWLEHWKNQIPATAAKVLRAALPPDAESIEPAAKPDMVPACCYAGPCDYKSPPIQVAKTTENRQRTGFERFVDSLPSTKEEQHG